jgi:hypothetical protein
MECQLEINKAKCNCTYEPCSRKGRCCECLAYHLESDELPACVFPPEVERTYPSKGRTPLPGLSVSSIRGARVAERVRLSYSNYYDEQEKESSIN